MPRKVEWFSNDEPQKIETQIEYFSLAEDVKLEKRTIRQRYRLLTQDFQRYTKSKKNSLKSEDLDILDSLLISKFNVLINKVEDQIKNGIFLSMALGITDPDTKKAADQFSREYRKLLIAKDKLHYIPKINQERVDNAYKALIGSLRKFVFGSVIQMFSRDPNELPPQVTDELEKKLLEEGNPTLSQLYEMCVGTFRSNNINAKVELKDNKIEISL